MIKIFLNFLFSFFVLSTWALADKMEGQLQSEYGKDLKNVPFFVKYSFDKKSDINWEKTNYPERLAFLSNYENEVMAEKAQEKADARAKAQKQRELSQQKYLALRVQNDRLRAEMEEQRIEDQENQDRQRAFNSLMMDQRQELDEIKDSYQQAKNN